MKESVFDWTLKYDGIDYNQGDGSYGYLKTAKMIY